MTHKVIVPRELISPEVNVDNDVDNNYAVQLRIKWKFNPEVHAWLSSHIGKIPTIMITSYDFEPLDYWIEFDVAEIAEAFKLAWY